MKNDLPIFIALDFADQYSAILQAYQSQTDGESV